MRVGRRAGGGWIQREMGRRGIRGGKLKHSWLSHSQMWTVFFLTGSWEI